MQEQSLKAFIEHTLRNAGTILIEKYGKVSVECAKNGDPHAIVTEADTASQTSIVEAIRKEYPTHTIVAEEAGLDINDLDGKNLWCIDPLDGTRNFES